jgi:hypothetical protein
MMPMMLPMMLTRSEAYRASWVFHATPANGTNLVIAAKNAVVVLVMLPCLTLVAVVLGVTFLHPLHALVHTAILGLISHLGLLAATGATVELPFARPARKAEMSARYIILSICAAAVAGVVQPVLIWLVYPSGTATATVVFSLVALTVAGEFALRRRVQSRLCSAEFEF